MSGPAGDQSRVQDDLLVALRQHGMHCPIRGLSDPHLQYPELLMIGGWERTDVAGGVGYRMVADENPATKDTWEQYYEVHDDGSDMLVTRAGHKVQTLTESSDGRITSNTKNVD